MRNIEHPGEASHWRIRLGDSSDYAAICKLAEAVYGTAGSVERIRWLYEKNPAGRCQLWVAEEEVTRRIVGIRPVFPWRMRVGDRDVLACQAGDAMTHPEFQGRGIFTSLVREAWSSLRDRGVPFGFSFSNPGALSVYRKTPVGVGPRAGTHDVLGFQRMVYLLSLRPILGGLPGARRLADLFDRVYRPYRWRRLALPGNLSTFPVHRFDEEFDDLWAKAGGEHGLLTVRDTAYLNWRFMDGPGGPFCVLGLRRRGELAGYVAFEVDVDGVGWIADLFGFARPEIVAGLVTAALAAIFQAGGVMASISAAVENPFFGLIRDIGFIQRDLPSPMVVHVYHDGPEADAALRPGRWWAWSGDRDVQRLTHRPRVLGQ